MVLVEKVNEATNGIPVITRVNLIQKIINITSNKIQYNNRKV